MVEKVEQLYERHGRKVSLVGWSLGGIYARQLAKMLPDKVRLVVTLGSPFAGDPRATNAWRLYDSPAATKWMTGNTIWAARFPIRLQCRRRRSTSRTTESATGETASKKEGPFTENIEVGEAAIAALAITPRPPTRLPIACRSRKANGKNSIRVAPRRCFPDPGR
jgi:pimeloyl-ACP methyl ester carboxylesterase